jgi:hypothetical protein
MNDFLRETLEDHAEADGCFLKDLTVLSKGHDPYAHFDTQKYHEYSQWLTESLTQVDHSRVGTRIHARGIHYKLLGRVIVTAGFLREKPPKDRPKGTDGKPMPAHPYANNVEHWEWLMDEVIKAARWLGYLPFSATKDSRNPVPNDHTRVFIPPWWSLSAGQAGVRLPDTLEPTPRTKGSMSGLRPRSRAGLPRVGAHSDILAKLDHPRAQPGRVQGRCDQLFTT